MKQAAIFDLDGVIVDTARFHYLAWKRLAAELGFQFTEAQNERLKGVSRMQSLEYLLDSGGLQNRFFPGGKREDGGAEKPVVRGADRHTDGKGPAARRRTPFERAEGCGSGRCAGIREQECPADFEEPWNTGAVRRRGGWKYGFRRPSRTLRCLPWEPSWWESPMKTAPYLRTARLESKRRTVRECIPSASAGRVPCRAARSRSQIFP